MPKSDSTAANANTPTTTHDRFDVVSPHAYTKGDGETGTEWFSPSKRRLHPQAAHRAGGHRRRGDADRAQARAARQRRGRKLEPTGLDHTASPRDTP